MQSSHPVARIRLSVCARSTYRDSPTPAPSDTVGARDEKPLDILHQPAADRVELRFDSETELNDFVQAAREQGAVLLELKPAPRPFAQYRIRLRLEPEFEIDLEASVVQLFEEAGRCSAAFQLESMSRGWDLEYARRLRQAKAPAGDASEMTGQPPIVRIRQMNVRQRMHLASKADRIERATLIRDSSPQVLMGLVTNPRIGSDDIVQIIRNPQVSPGVLDRITRETRWLANGEIQKALVRNPKTPGPIALRLVDSLPTEELRKLGKMQSGLREPLRKAALRAYLKRTRR